MEAIYTYCIATFTFTKLKTFLAFLFGIFWTIIGGFTVMVQAMFILLVLDFILGFIIAWKDWTISKKKMQLGIVKIVAYCLTLIVLNYTNIVIWWINFNWFWILEFWVSYLGINEALSCLKHLWNLWVPIPIWIIKKLENYKENLEMKDLSSK